MVLSPLYKGSKPHPVPHQRIFNCEGFWATYAKRLCGEHWNKFGPLSLIRLGTSKYVTVPCRAVTAEGSGEAAEKVASGEASGVDTFEGSPVLEFLCS